MLLTLLLMLLTLLVSSSHSSYSCFTLLMLLRSCSFMLLAHAPNARCLMLLTLLLNTLALLLTLLGTPPHVPFTPPLLKWSSSRSSSCSSWSSISHCSSPYSLNCRQPAIMYCGELCHPLLTSSVHPHAPHTFRKMNPVADRRGAMCMHCLLSTAKTSRKKRSSQWQVNSVIVRVAQFLEWFFFFKLKLMRSVSGEEGVWGTLEGQWGGVWSTWGAWGGMEMKQDERPAPLLHFCVSACWISADYSLVLSLGLDPQTSRPASLFCASSLQCLGSLLDYNDIKSSNIISKDSEMNNKMVILLFSL